jgi:hypothetical protein
MRAAIIASFLLFITACSHNEHTQLPRTGNAVYYWRTLFSLNDTEQTFLRTHNIKTIYCRYFDVVNNADNKPVPNATIQFAQAVPDGIELIPTVFIMNNCMQHPSDSLATKIVDRITQMNETNGIHNVRELQIDCDYTLRNRAVYYTFLRQVATEARMRGMSLSVTIRLHQLSMPAPPVDYGVLMLYNTGAPERFTERNPILDLRDVEPYIRHLKGFPLPLAAAYPVFRWQRTIHGVDITHMATIDDILRTKRLVEAERSDLRQLILTYHLDKENIERYTQSDYEKILNH